MAAADDGEAWVEDENDGGVVGEHGDIEDPHLDLAEEGHKSAGFGALARYLTSPWLLLLMALLAYQLWKKCEPALEEWRKKRQAAARVALFKKNPELYRQRMEAMERARRKQQEINDLATKEYAEKKKALEEEKKARRLQELDSLAAGKGYRNKSKADEDQSDSLRPGYNPLMSSGEGSCTRRPFRRSAGGAGG